MKKIYLPLIFLMLLLSGCVPTKCNLDTLSKEEKKKIYSEIQSEVDNIIDDADTYYAKSYYLQALKSYELINFYGDDQKISSAKMEHLKKRIEANKKHYYNKAVSKKYAKDKMRQLFYLNELMRNDPEYKNAKELYLALREDEEVVQALQKDKAILETLLEKDSNSKTYIAKLNDTINKIARYDDMDPLVQEAQNILKQKRYHLQENAVKLFKKNKIAEANQEFSFIKEIYKRDKKADRYLRYIKKNNKLNTMESKALSALEELNYQEAIDIANEILAFNNNNSKALEIFKKANTELKKQIPKMINKATQYYSKQEYTKALEAFQNVLKLDSANNTALTYTKKIKAQLRTIQNLKAK